MLFLSACSGGSNSYYESSTPNIADDSIEDDVLKVRTLNFATPLASPRSLPSNESHMRIIETEMKTKMAYKGIDFQLNLIDSSFGNDFNNMQLMLSPLLKSGEVDIFVVVGHPLVSFARSGYLADIYQLIYQDPTVDLDDFHIGALELFEVDGILTAIPSLFTVPMIGINASLPLSIIERFSQLSMVTVYDMLEIFNELNYQYSGFEHLHPIHNFRPERLVLFELNNHIDLSTNTFNFNIPGFTSFLTNFWSFIDPNARMANRIFHPFHPPHVQQALSELVVFSFHNDVLLLAQALMEKDDPFFVYQIPLAVDSGVLLMYPEWDSFTFQNKTYAIANTENADLAWEFLKQKLYFHAYGTQHSASGWNTLETPIRRDWYDDRTRAIFNEFFAPDQTLFRAYPPAYTLPFSARGDAAAEQKAIDNAIMRHFTYINMPMAIPPLIPYGLFEEYLNDFQRGIISADTAAQQIANSIYLWMQEQ